MSGMPSSDNEEGHDSAGLQPIEIEFDLVGTTEVNSDGTPRQEIIDECDDQPMIFLGQDESQGVRRIRVLVRRKKYFDSGRYFGWVGEFPWDVMERYRPHFDAGWRFARREAKVIRSGSKLGLRFCGQLLPPEPKSGDDDVEGRWDL